VCAEPWLCCSDLCALPATRILIRAMNHESRNLGCGGGVGGTIGGVMAAGRQRRNKFRSDDEAQLQLNTISSQHNQI